MFKPGFAERDEHALTAFRQKRRANLATMMNKVHMQAMSHRWWYERLKRIMSLLPRKTIDNSKACEDPIDIYIHREYGPL